MTSQLPDGAAKKWLEETGTDLLHDRIDVADDNQALRDDLLTLARLVRVGGEHATALREAGFTSASEVAALGGPASRGGSATRCPRA